MPRILILEKDAVTAWELRGELVLGGQYEVVVESDPREALALMQDEPFDLVLADWAWVDGGYLCEKIRKDHFLRQVPVIMTGPEQQVNDPGVVEHMLRRRFGCHDYVTRPFDYEQLRELIDVYVVVGKIKNNMLAKPEES